MSLKALFITGILNIILLPESFCLIESNLLMEYYKMKSINSIVIFTCVNKSEMVKLSENLLRNDIFVSIRNINTTNKQEIGNLVVKHGQQGIVLDTDCANHPTILNNCAEEELYFDKYKWLIFSNHYSILKTMKDVYMSVNAEITIVFRSTSSESFWDLIDVYNPGYNHGGTLKINHLGSWDPVLGFHLNKSMNLPKYIRRKDLSDLHFTGMIILIYSYPGELLDYLYNNEQNKTLDNFTRYYFLLFDHIKDLHNFTLIVKLGYIYGSIASNGSFTGLVGFLQRKEIDFGLTPIYYKTDRTPFVDYLVPTYLMKCRFIFQHPKPALTIRGAFFSPLSTVVWVCTWGIMIITGLLIRVAFKHEWQLERLRYDERNYTEHDWSYIVLLLFGGVCQQDVPRVPHLYSSRAVVIISILFTYLLYQFYSGGIVSSLLSEPPKSIRNLQDLLHSHLKIGVEDIVYERDYFNQTTDPIAIELYKTKIIGKKNGSAAFYNVKTGMEYVKQGEFAFQTDTSTGYAIIAEKYSNEVICQLGEVQLYPNQFTAGVIQQDSPFRELLVYSFQRMIEAGIVHRQRIKWTTKKPECIHVADSSTIFVGINEFFPAVLFYMVGIVITFIIFGIELWINQKQRYGKYSCSLLYCKIK